MQQRKKLRDLFEENYTAVKTSDRSKKGYRIEYIYSGPWYIWDLEEPRLKKEKRQIFLLGMLSVILFLAAGLQNASVNTNPYSVIPALLVLCIQVLELTAAFQFICAKYKTTRMTYNRVDRILGGVSGIELILQLWITGLALWLFVRADQNLISFLTLLLYGASAFLTFVIYKKFNRIGFYTEKNNSVREHEERFTVG